MKKILALLTTCCIYLPAPCMQTSLPIAPAERASTASAASSSSAASLPATSSSKPQAPKEEVEIILAPQENDYINGPIRGGGSGLYNKCGQYVAGYSYEGKLTSNGLI